MSIFRLTGVAVALLAPCPLLLADRHVVVIARANPEYAEARIGVDGQPRTETYVLMEGHHYPGHTVDRTMERMTFREIAGFFAPELTRRRYLPGTSPAAADLLLIVHWGATTPKVGVQEMTAKPATEVDRDRLMLETMRDFSVPVDLEGNFDGIPDSVRLPFGHEFELEQDFVRLDRLTDELSQQMRRSDNVTLLGYSDDLHRLGKRVWTGELERSLRHDLNTARYFVIIRAYDLKQRIASVPRNRPVWTMHLNISAPGNNFRTALARMSVAAARFAGTNTGEPETVRITGRETVGTVTFGELVILGEAPRN
ncbi:MAG: hypothetical protein ACOZE5_16560 [Verrucomicrobiota bacterium]